MTSFGHRTRIKFCGFTREADVDAAVAAGADAVGFVLYPPSARAVTVERAAALAARLPAFVQPVLLVVNADAALLDAACAAVPGAVLQFHGDEAASDCEAWHARTRRPYLRAARMAPDFALLDFARAHPHAAGLVLDAHVDGYGGGGKAFDWSLIPAHVPRPVVLSGGLHVANVIDGVTAVQPWGVDVSTGVEAAKGIKDAALMQAFSAAVREADARLAALD